MAACSLILLTSFIFLSSLAQARVRFGRRHVGEIKYINHPGFGACGRRYNPRRDLVAAISETYFTTENPNKDPYCKEHVCIEVKTRYAQLVLPVEDKCPTCKPSDLMVSLPAYNSLTGRVDDELVNVPWKFVHCPGVNNAAE